MPSQKPALDDPQVSAPWHSPPAAGTIILDEMVPRSLDSALNDNGYACYLIRELFRTTSDEPLLKWCDRHGFVLATNNCQDFNRLDKRFSHSGLLLYSQQSFAGNNPGGFVNAVDRIDRHYGLTNLDDEVVWVSKWTP